MEEKPSSLIIVNDSITTEEFIPNLLNEINNIDTNEMNTQ